MQFIDLKTEYQNLKEELEVEMTKVMQSGAFIMGPQVTQCEAELANLIGMKHCNTNASGTTALQLALMALDIGPGDEVITSDFSFMATAETIAILGAKPVFVDIDPLTYNIDPVAIEAAITPKTKAIIPVDLYGQCADYDAILKIANAHNLHVIADSAQSIGATYKGKNAGSFGLISCTSFYPSKPLGCYGDGGACFTNDDAIALKLAKLRNHGDCSRYEHEMIGINGRFDTLQAAVILVKLKHFKDTIKARARVAELYNRRLRPAGLAPFVCDHNTSVYAQYTVRVANRDEVQAYLKECNIPTAVHYPRPLHAQPAFALDNLPQNPHALLASREVMSLPFHPYLTEEEVNEVCDCLLKVAKNSTAQSNSGCTAL